MTLPLILIPAYFFTRLYHILALPVFNDEAIYIRFAQTIARDPGHLFVPLTQPNEPLFMWINALIYDLFRDPLLGGRIISVMAGLGNMAGLYLIGRDQFSRNAGIAAAILYILLPYPLIFDRMAHVDSLLNLFNIWFIYAALRVFHGSLSLPMGAVMAGILSGGGILTKSSAVLFLAAPVSFLILVKRDREKIVFLALACLIGLALFSPVLLAKQGPVLSGGSKILHNVRFIHTLPELIALPVRTWGKNLGDMAQYLVRYVSLPVLFLACVGFLSAPVRKGLVFFSWFCLPALFFVLMARFSYSRWFLICVPPLILLAGNGAHALKKLLDRRARDVPLRIALPAGLFLVCLPALGFDYRLLSDPAHAPWVASDRDQYVRNEFSGYGIPGLVNFLKAAGKMYPATVLVTDNWGNPGDALFLYLEKEKNIEIFSTWWWTRRPVLAGGKGPVEVYQNKYTGDSLLVELPGRRENIFFVCRSTAFPQREFLLRNPDFKRVRSFPKPESAVAYELYKWKGRPS